MWRETTYGIESTNAVTVETFATNNACSRNSRQANGGLKIATRMSSDKAKNPPMLCSGLAAPGRGHRKAADLPTTSGAEAESAVSTTSSVMPVA